MAVDATVFQMLQIAPENTSGSNNTTTKVIQSFSIMPTLAAEIGTFRPMGQKFATIATPGKEMTTADITGIATYTEAVYLFSSVINTGSVSGSAAPYTWTFNTTGSAADTPKSLTCQVGTSGSVVEWAYGLVDGLGITFDRSADTVAMKGTMMGQLATLGTAMDAGAAAISIVPVLSNQVNVYMDTAGSSLGGTQLTNVLMADWNITGRYNPEWTLNASNTSWAQLVETPPTMELKLEMEYTTTTAALVTNMRAGDTRFLRIKGTSGTNEFQIDMAGKVTDISSFSDRDGVYAVTFTFTGVYDATWGKALLVTIKNTLSAL